MNKIIAFCLIWISVKANSQTTLGRDIANYSENNTNEISISNKRIDSKPIRQTSPSNNKSNHTGDSSTNNQTISTSKPLEGTQENKQGTIRRDLNDTISDKKRYSLSTSPF